ncbi:hypothetical protein AJ80_09800 [Polytolypa hystricis UAMH7299]|uniref:Uncharacterized protein n=1 Tax=Polytolypa hystricis (strain UAMH7299) TaxID=1447883 RepID=A0A2B7WJ40_POLH7|nr:hypothetical protein AJ80_09800 [Polytolypa hystricis UAMH7299]
MEINKTPGGINNNRDELIPSTNWVELVEENNEGIVFSVEEPVQLPVLALVSTRSGKSMNITLTSLLAPTNPPISTIFRNSTENLTTNNTDNPATRLNITIFLWEYTTTPISKNLTQTCASQE